MKPLKPHKLESKLAKHLPHKVLLLEDAPHGERLAAMAAGREWCNQRFTKEFVVAVDGTPHYNKKAEWYLSHTGYFHFARKKHLKRFKAEHEG